jgi:hypothetical protein
MRSMQIQNMINSAFVLWAKRNVKTLNELAGPISTSSRQSARHSDRYVPLRCLIPLNEFLIFGNVNELRVRIFSLFQLDFIGVAFIQ